MVKLYDYTNTTCKISCNNFFLLIIIIFVFGITLPYFDCYLSSVYIYKIVKKYLL